MTPAAAARHPHLADRLPTGRVRVDMHSHTMWSGDASTTVEEVVQAVDETALDVVCITDHGAIAGADRLAAVGVRVIAGQEVRTGAGEIIGLFLTSRLPFGLRPEEACEEIRRQGGIVYIPHPFDELRHALERPVLERLVADGLVDAIEVFNAKVRAPAANALAASFATEHAVLAGAGSDAHEPSAFGAAYVEMDDFSDPASFMRALRGAVVRGHLYDAARQWRPRILPSISPDA